MRQVIKSLVTISALSSLAIAPVFMSAGEAFAGDKKGTDASYVGIGVGGQVTNGGQQNDAANLGGNITGRYQVANPVSVRTNINWNNDTTAINPYVSLDAGIAKNTNVYVGAGYAMVEKDGQSSPLGNQDSVTANVGVERQVGKNLMIYSNATVGFDSYENSSRKAVNVGGGLGYSFK